MSSIHAEYGKIIVNKMLCLKSWLTCAFIGMGFAAYHSPVLGIAVSAGIFFIIKTFMSKSSKMLLNASKGGICIQCGHKSDECAC